jgi:putative addiction module component (TIGR02574 family)
MAPTIQDLGIDRLSAEHRLRLISEIWDSLSIEDTPIPERDREELDRRLHAADASPEAGTPWEVVRERLRAAK